MPNMMSNSASFEGRSHLVLHHFGARAVADDAAGGIFQALDAAHVDAHRRIVLQRPAAGVVTSGLP